MGFFPPGVVSHPLYNNREGELCSFKNLYSIISQIKSVLPPFTLYKCLNAGLVSKVDDNWKPQSACEVPLSAAKQRINYDTRLVNEFGLNLR